MASQAGGLTHAACEVHVTLNGAAAECGVEAILTQKDNGRVVARGRAAAGEVIRFDVHWPLLWSPERPHLYVLTVRLGDGADEVKDVVGFRRIEVQGRDILLNGKRLVLKGVCRHEFTSASGYSPGYEETYRELAMIKHAGFNYIRLVHSPQARIVPRIAAELGILVSEEPGTCFHDLADEAIAAPAVEAMRRTVLRDRNCPSILAWYIYNECNPSVAYAVRVAKMIRKLDPDCRLSFADCSRQNDNIKAMVREAGLSWYGINIYDYGGKAYVDMAEVFDDRPLVITEWGGWPGQNNPHVLSELSRMFVRQTREDATIRLAGCAFWVWADYEEFSRNEPAAVDGWTIEGLVDKRGEAKADLAILSGMCFEMDHAKALPRPRVQVLAQGVAREGWRCVSLEDVGGDQAGLEKLLPEHWPIPHWPAGSADQKRELARTVPVFERLMVGGIEFAFRKVPPVPSPADPRRGGPPCPPIPPVGTPAAPAALTGRREQAILLGPGHEEVVIPVGQNVRRIAVLGHVALRAGYPGSYVASVHHRDAEPVRKYGDPAAEYVFEFEDGTEVQPLLHGVHVLRSNNICRWWMTSPRAAETVPGVQCEVHPSYEVLRMDLWERDFGRGRVLKAIRWRLKDGEAMLGMWGVSVGGE